MRMLIPDVKNKRWWIGQTFTEHLCRFLQGAGDITGEKGCKSQSLAMQTKDVLLLWRPQTGHAEIISGMGQGMREASVKDRS